MTLKNSKGFTLVEMLVVIAIISVLAAAHFPAIPNALDSASATALKQKGRGIWVAITSANMEREPLNLDTVWPEDAESEGVSDAVGYFNYLLSDGTTKTQPTSDHDLRVVADLTPDALIASGITAGTDASALTAKNIAWGVVKVGDKDPSEVAFLISKNCQNPGTLQQVPSETTEILELDKDTKPFGQKRVAWVSRGGGTFDARRKYFTMSKLMGLGESTDTYDFWSTAAE